MRDATAEDAAELTDIRTYYVLNTHATFATAAPTVEETRSWLGGFPASGPHRLVVAVVDDELIGYAATSRYRPTAPFDTTAELSVYLTPDRRSRGVGTALYGHLLPLAAEHGIHTFVAGVALPNDASVGFHRSQGFREVGIFEEYAVKNGRFISSVWFQKTVGSGRHA